MAAESAHYDSAAPPESQLNPRWKRPPANLPRRLNGLTGARPLRKGEMPTTLQTANARHFVIYPRRHRPPSGQLIAFHWRFRLAWNERPWSSDGTSGSAHPFGRQSVIKLGKFRPALRATNRITGVAIQIGCQHWRGHFRTWSVVEMQGKCNRDGARILPEQFVVVLTMGTHSLPLPPPVPLYPHAVDLICIQCWVSNSERRQGGGGGRRKGAGGRGLTRMLTNTRGAAHLNRGCAVELHFRLFVLTEADWPLIIFSFLFIFFSCCCIFLIQFQFGVLIRFSWISIVLFVLSRCSGVLLGFFQHRRGFFGFSAYSLWLSGASLHSENKPSGRG